MSISIIISAFLVLGLSAMLIITGIIKQPGIGIIGSLIIIVLISLLRGNKPFEIGLQTQSINWTLLIFRGIGYAIILFIVSTFLIDPLSELLTNSSPTYGPLDNIKDNWILLVKSLIFVWLFVAIAEEVIFRGFLNNEINKLIGSSLPANIFSILFTSIVFGLCHAYQNKCGVLSTGIIGLIFGCIFLLNGKNLWELIIIHGVLDTVAICSMYFGLEPQLQHLKEILWKR
jgi:membrane protease YdiL (CAAX protease family)